MVVVTIQLRMPTGTPTALHLELDSGYGRNATEAHEMVLLCLLGPRYSLLIDSEGELWSLPREVIVGILTRDESAGS